MLPSAELEPVPDVPALDDAARRRRRRGALGARRDQAQRRPRDDDGSRAPEVARRRARRPLVPRDPDRPDARRSAAVCGIELPLLLMDSEATRADTLRALAGHPELDQGLPADFLQGMIPKLERDTLAPVSWPRAPALEWCPPGHGDVYGALRRSGVLARAARARLPPRDDLERRQSRRDTRPADRGVRRARADPVPDGGRRRAPRPTARAATSPAGAPTARSCCARPRRRRPRTRTRSATTATGATTTPTTSGSTCEALAGTLERSAGVLELPLIVNPKTVDPRDPTSPAVLQLESAMGAAIERFGGARIAAAFRARASSRSRRPTICSCCAPTPTR